MAAGEMEVGAHSGLQATDDGYGCVSGDRSGDTRVRG